MILNKRMNITVPVMLLLVCLPGAGVRANGFTVVKNVNTGELPKDALVLFERGMDPEKYEIFDNEHCRMSLNADGDLVADLGGNGLVHCGVKLKAQAGDQTSFRAEDYQYVVIKAKIVGSFKTTRNGKVSTRRPENLWFSAALFDAEGNPVARANMADGTPDSRHPEETAYILLPMKLVTYWNEEDLPDFTGIGFHWREAGANTDRDFDVVIEKISLAN